MKNILFILATIFLTSQSWAIEDDCVPEDNLFRFCQELLELYLNDNEVGAICGFYSNQQDYKPKNSYFFSRYLRVWGWAGWRRTFENYDSNLKKLIKTNDNWQDNIFERSDIFLAVQYFAAQVSDSD